MSTATLAFRVPLEIKQQIEKLAISSHRKKSDILLSWINEKLDLERWQIEETKKAISLADAGYFATEKELSAVYKKWGI
jgi:predicted transcriptional regulator